jgi:hypothetical protein
MAFAIPYSVLRLVPDSRPIRSIRSIRALRRSLAARSAAQWASRVVQKDAYGMHGVTACNNPGPVPFQ